MKKLNIVMGLLILVLCGMLVAFVSEISPKQVWEYGKFTVIHYYNSPRELYNGDYYCWASGDIDFRTEHQISYSYPLSKMDEGLMKDYIASIGKLAGIIGGNPAQFEGYNKDDDMLREGNNKDYTTFMLNLLGSQGWELVDYSKAEVKIFNEGLVMVESKLVTQIKALEIQLAVLKEQLKRLGSTKPTKSFADLYGILAGKISSSEEEINAIRYGFEWEGTKER